MPITNENLAAIVEAWEEYKATGWVEPSWHNYARLVDEHGYEMAQELRALRELYRETQDILAHPEWANKCNGELHTKLLFAETEIEKLRAQLKLAEIHRRMAGVTEEEVLEALDTPQREALKEGKWA